MRAGFLQGVSAFADESRYVALGWSGCLTKGGPALFFLQTLAMLCN